MGTHKINFTFLVGKWSQKTPAVLPLGVKYGVTTWDSLKTDRKTTDTSETSARINLTTKLHFEEDRAVDVDLV